MSSIYRGKKLTQLQPQRPPRAKWNEKVSKSQEGTSFASKLKTGIPNKSYTRDTELCVHFNPGKNRKSIYELLKAINFPTSGIEGIVQRQNGLVDFTCKTRQQVILLQEKMNDHKKDQPSIRNAKLYIQPYEHQPNFCEYCSEPNHEERSCPTKKSNQEHAKSNQDQPEVNNELKETPENLDNQLTPTHE
ncbi:unnamed protein product, partial [Clavelina lepadiformis]